MNRIRLVHAIADVQERERAARIWVVVPAKEPAEGVEAKAERIPKAGGNARQFAPIGPAAVDVAALAAAAQRRSVGANQLVRQARVLAEAEEHVALRIEREAG